MRLHAFAALAALLLAGCAGADFKLPQFTAAEVDHAALVIEGSSASLPSNARSDAENRAMVARVASRLGENLGPLCRQSDVSPCWFDITYDQDDEVNAYAEGKNRIHVLRGLLRYLDSDEEVAAVVAHEIGHHLGNHIAEKQRNAGIGAVIGGLLMGAAMAASGYDPAYDYNNSGGQAVQQSMQLGAQIGAISYSKSQEREADLFAAYILARAEYDLDEAGKVWVVLAKMSDKSHASLLDTHPAGPERIVAWDKAVKEVRGSGDLLPDPD
ncbi:MAG TPA: M48 family metalloprotease [Alphaproteobacteria bacterium]|nr:M48 family metalloprotease [Alphaproteobacteria bacterium]